MILEDKLRRIGRSVKLNDKNQKETIQQNGNFDVML